MSKEAPFFIIGSERSGTTLLMVILGEHPRIAVPEVTWFYPRFRAYLHTYGDLSHPANLRTLVSEIIFGLKTPFFGLSVNPRTIVDELLARIPRPNFREVFAAVLGYYAEQVGKPRWGEKTPHHLYYVREILEDFPDAKFLHLTRDGRDVAADQLQSAFGPRNITAAARIWRQTQEEARRWRQQVPANQWLDVSYEQLAREPERITRQSLDFLGEPFDPAVLGFHQGEIAQRRAQTRDHRALGEPVNEKHIGIYRRFLSANEQAIFHGIAGDFLDAAGYADTTERVELSAKEIAFQEELDGRIRAATLNAPQGHIVYESYNDWLADQWEERRRRGVWQGTPIPRVWEDEFLRGQRAPAEWKRAFAIPRQYEAAELVL